VTANFDVAHIDDLDAFPVDDEGLTWRPIRRHFGIGAFGTNAYTAERAGQRVVEDHTEADNHEELYVVIAGRATFTLDEQSVDAPAGTLVFCRPGARRGAVAAEDGTTILAVGAKPGAAFEPSPWEEAFAGAGYARLGELEQARAIFRAEVERHPQAWQGLFNWACVEARLGDREVALEQLERAAALAPEEVAAQAAGDSDFDAIRGDPRFLAVTGQA
jgi:tetratricopeptide (TPR) repeat protein